MVGSRQDGVGRAKNTGPPRQIGARIGLVAVGIIVGLVALEVALQLAALFVQSSSGPTPQFLSGPRRVVCLGDSNTYGLYVDRQQAWPQQLEALWGSATEREPIQVVNLGYPGVNSSRIRNQLPSIIDALHPDLVLVMVGANDVWTMPDPPEEISPTFAMRAWRFSRVFRLFYMLSQWRGPQVEISGSMYRFRSPDEVDKKVIERGEAVANVEGLELSLAWRPANAKTSERWAQGLDTNLAAIADIAREADTALIFLTYPSNRDSVYGDLINGRLRTAAAATKTPLIDLGSAVEALCPSPCPTLFFKDHHPNARGYTRVAELLVETFRHLPALANTFGFTLHAVRNWEQGKRTPEGAARVLLLVISREPAAVVRALRRAA